MRRRLEVRLQRIMYVLLMHDASCLGLQNMIYKERMLENA